MKTVSFVVIKIDDEGGVTLGGPVHDPITFRGIIGAGLEAYNELLRGAGARVQAATPGDIPAAAAQAEAASKLIIP